MTSPLQSASILLTTLNATEPIFMAHARMRCRTAAYYIELRGSGADQRQILDAARRVWTQALSDRHGSAARQALELISLTEEQFDLGFGRATDYCSTT